MFNVGFKIELFDRYVLTNFVYYHILETWEIVYTEITVRTYPYYAVVKRTCQTVVSMWVKHISNKFLAKMFILYWSYHILFCYWL